MKKKIEAPDYFSVPLNSKGKKKHMWYHLDYRDLSTINMLKDDYGLDEDTVEALTEHQTRPRYFSVDDGIVFVLRAINGDFDKDDREMVSLRAWLDKDKLITMSSHKIDAVCEVFHKIESGKGVDNPVDCFIEIVSKIADDISDKVYDITDNTDAIEDKVIDTELSREMSLRAEIGNIRRRIVAIRRYLAPLRDIYIHMRSEKTTFFNEDQQKDLREIYNSFTASLEDLDYARDHLTVSSEELQGKTNVRISKIMYFISIVTVIFMPMGLLTSLLGINVSGIPYADEPNAFLFVALGLITICSCILLILKKIKWI